MIKLFKYFIYSFILLISIVNYGCNEEKTNSLSVNLQALELSANGGIDSLILSTDAPSWTIRDDVEWLEYSNETGGSGYTIIYITALKHTGSTDRTATITIHADDAEDIIIQVTQEGRIYPDYNINPLPPDLTGMEKTAMEIANEIVIGWNIGNSMEAIGGESNWGNPLITPGLIDMVKENGFNAIRIPCSFNQYAPNSSTAEISAEWLERVKTVVGYCVDNDMYAILNIHWDGGWLENNVTTSAEEINTAKQKAFWEQIATYLRDFDEHLLFASTNEPNADNSIQMRVLNSYHQACIDAVRSTGGKNAYRTIVVQGPNTDISLTNELMNELPIDNVESRMMVEVHYYTPWNFCGMTEDANWGKMFYYWGKNFHSATDTDRNATYGEEATVDQYFERMKNKFVNVGIPVVLGEYSVTRRSNLTGYSLKQHLDSRAHYFYYVTKMAKQNGIIPFYWDNGYTGDYGCAIFNRVEKTVFDQQALDALILGANE